MARPIAPPVHGLDAVEHALVDVVRRGHMLAVAAAVGVLHVEMRVVVVEKRGV